jgi:predicted NAD-dependent protein-ADP-ribosyltransferase YbiA (DUF1768 family)
VAAPGAGEGARRTVSHEASLLIVKNKIYIPLQLPYEFDPDVEPILGFEGEFDFLSNFKVHPVLLPGGITLPSSEHVYMMEKDSDPAYKKKIREAKTPGQAKRIGYTAKLPDDWDLIQRFIAMHGALKRKYVDPLMAHGLLSTGFAYLEETNRHGDKFWGRCNGEGLNHLGRQLMVIRHMLVNGQLIVRM